MIIKSSAETAMLERIQRIVMKQFDICPSLASPSTRFHEDLGADALDWVEIVMTVAREFGEDVLDEDFKEVQTVGELAAYIERKQNMLTNMIHA